jgi:hypothetical protein
MEQSPVGEGRLDGTSNWDDGGSGARFGAAATTGGSDGSKRHPNDKRPTAPETACGCTEGAKL